MAVVLLSKKQHCVAKGGMRAQMKPLAVNAHADESAESTASKLRSQMANVSDESIAPEVLFSGLGTEEIKIWPERE
ncbi:MAG TPA: hypothetical protein VIH83_06545 [Candidatus Bathyarchaeia archaeon]